MDNDRKRIRDEMSAAHQEACAAHRMPYAAPQIPCAAPRIPCAALQMLCAGLQMPCAALRVSCAAPQMSCAGLRIPCVAPRIPCAALWVARATLFSLFKNKRCTILRIAAFERYNPAWIVYPPMTVQATKSFIMDQHGKNKLKMYKAVEAICTVQQADWNDLPAFVNAFNRFTAKLQELDQAVFNQSFATPGVTKNKNQLLETTIEKAYIVANALRAYAAVQDDPLLEGKLDFPKSDFKRGGSQQAIVLVDTVLQLATSNLAALGDFGIEQEDVDELSALRQQLGSVIGSPREAIIDRRNETIAIERLIDELDDLLHDHLDRLIEVLRPDHPALYERFKSARVIVDHKGKKNHSGNGDEPDGE